MTVDGPGGSPWRGFRTVARTPGVLAVRQTVRSAGVGPPPLVGRTAGRKLGGDRDDGLRVRLSAPFPAVGGRVLYGSCNTGQRCQFEVLIRPVLKHGPRSLTCARVIWVYTPKGAMKLNVRLVGHREDGRAAHVAASRTPGASRSHCERRRTQSVHVGTRKMVNYAWPGRSQGKP